ncbi:hypothetical protein SLOPH_1668 [Spraguea lophii 42_110]|uniref:Uncharacterized protein n=1 Tax=Spraguea lophii (strain 42_110) TaxID=1358809 RepID=S7XGV9_SPRLO|nr:hypothetical protein SLOPH_1668 [Spraguea lophii 42_110]
MFNNIYLTSSLSIPNDYSIIYNNSKFLYSRKYFLIFTDNSILKTFRKILEDYDKIIIYVKNYEFFYFLFKEYRFINFIILDNMSTCEIYEEIGIGYNINNFDRRMDYKNIEEKIKKVNIKNKMIEKVYDEKEFYEGKDKGVELSFNPPLFDIYRTSLLRPDLYFTKETMIHKIVMELKEGKKTYNELKKKFKKNIDNELKSLIYTKVVEQKNEYFIFKL